MTVSKCKRSTSEVLSRNEAYLKNEMNIFVRKDSNIVSMIITNILILKG